MDQRDWEILDKQLRGANPTRRNDDVTALTVVMVFFAGMPSRPGELHPESLTDPDVILSHHPARATMRRLPPSIDDQVPPAAG